LVCGVAQDPETKTYFCRIAYGTSQNLSEIGSGDLVVGNLSLLNQLNLKKPTKFILHSGQQMAIMPWLPEFFQPWSDCTTPKRSSLPPEMQRWVGYELSFLTDLPQF
jgi:hypothetical protein